MAQKAKKEVGKRRSALENEARVRIVERCISIGIYDVSSIGAELKAQGHETSSRSIYKYIKQVRARLQEEDDELRALRRAVLIRDAQRYERVIFGKLMDANVTPRWKDLVGILKIREQLEAGRFDDFSAPKSPEGELYLEDVKRADELDKMIVEMLHKEPAVQTDLTLPDGSSIH